MNEGSVRLNKSKETVVGLDRNHHSMCKFANEDDVVYLKVLSRLHGEISEIGTKKQVEEQEARIKWLLESVPSTPTSIPV